jgi:hypothetical protein
MVSILRVKSLPRDPAHSMYNENERTVTGKGSAVFTREFTHLRIYLTGYAPGVLTNSEYSILRVGWEGGSHYE